MAGTNWQYAALTKGERLDKIRNGDTEVYNQEKARINTLINSYKELGLDTSEQETWVHSLDMAATNNYGKGGNVSAEEKLYNSNRLSSGEISSYTSVYPSNKSVKDRLKNAGKVSAANPSSQLSSGNIYSSENSGYNTVKEDALSDSKQMLESAYSARQSALDRYYSKLNAQAKSEYFGKKQEAFAYAMKRLPALRENLANAGLHPDGGTSRSEQLQYQAGLDNALSSLDAQHSTVESGNNRAKESESEGLYSDYVKTLTEEQARLDELYYKIGRDSSDDAYRKAQLAQQQAQYERDAQSADAKSVTQNAQWEKEYTLKSDAQQYEQTRKTALDETEQEQFNLEFNLKLKQADKEVTRWEKEFDLKSSQAAQSQSNADRDYEFKLAQAQSAQSNTDREYEYKNSQLQTQREQVLREYTLKAMAQDESASKAQRDYALELLENSQSYEKWQSELAAKQQSDNSEQPSDKSDTVKQKDSPDARSDSYNAFLDTARWMKNSAKGTGGSTERQFTDSQITDWIASLPISSRQRKDMLEELGLGG